MKSKAPEHVDEIEAWKGRAAQRLARFKGKALERELERAVRAVEAEAGVKLPRHKAPMARPVGYRRAQ